MGQPGARSLAVVGIVVLAAACAGGPEPDAARLQAQAHAALARWADAVAASAAAAGFVPVGELTSQAGDWEVAVGGNNKSALYAGMVQAGLQLPADAPPDGQIQWPDGTTTSIGVMSATRALEELRSSATSTCPECTPLLVTGARLTSGALETSRGTATVPMWAFSLAGTAVQVTRVAVAAKTTVVPPPWDPMHAPSGISIDGAMVSPDGRQLTVSFVGAPDPASKPCGEDYTGEAVESDLAVVVIVHVRRNPTIGGCTAVGADRSTTVALAAPLGDRTVLEVKEGLPVAVTPGG